MDRFDFRVILTTLQVYCTLPCLLGTTICVAGGWCLRLLLLQRALVQSQAVAKRQLDEYRHRQLVEMRVERLRAQQQRAKRMQSKCQTSSDVRKLTLRRAKHKQDEAAQQLAKQYHEARKAKHSAGREQWLRDQQAKQTAASKFKVRNVHGQNQKLLHRSDLNNPPRHSIDPAILAAPPTLSIREEITVHGLGITKQRGTAILDTGNHSLTVISRQFAESLGLVNDTGMPTLMSATAVHTIEARGVVAGSSEIQFIVPQVRWEVKGVEIVSDMSVGLDGGIEGSCDVLISMSDIDKLCAFGQATFAPTRRNAISEISRGFPTTRDYFTTEEEFESVLRAVASANERSVDEIEALQLAISRSLAHEEQNLAELIEANTELTSTDRESKT